MSNKGSSERDASPHEKHDAADLDRAATAVDAEIEAGPDETPPSRRQLARETAAELLDETDQNGLTGAKDALKSARVESKQAAEQLDRAQQALETAEELREQAATVERLLQHVVRERSFYAGAGEELATSGSGEDLETLLNERDSDLAARLSDDLLAELRAVLGNGGEP